MSLRIPYNNSGETTIQLTLSESLTGETISGLTFHFVFSYEQTDTEISTGITDISSIPKRINEFTVTTLISSSILPFAESGWYNYKVYEDDSLSNLLESGKCYVYESTTSFNYDPDNTDYVYNN